MFLHKAPHLKPAPALGSLHLSALRHLLHCMNSGCELHSELPCGAPFYLMSKDLFLEMALS